ncbi:hypothetical protein ACA910_013458 [Epithemia clementina (nom. ined.)]
MATSSSDSNRGRGKRVEFAPNLGLGGDSGDCHSPSNNNQNHNSGNIIIEPRNERQHLWDSETDHMLSYFLGGGDSQTNICIPDFPSTDFAIVGGGDSTTIEGPSSNDSAWNGAMISEACGMPQLLPGASILNDPRAYGNNNHKSSHNNNSNSHKNVGLSLIHSDEEDEDDDDGPMAPPTPKVPQFFSRSSSSNNNHNHNHNSNNINSNNNGNISEGSKHSMYYGDCMTRNAIFSGHSLPQSSAVPSSGSSSSSSLSTMANTLVSGGPMLFQQIRQQQHQHHHQHHHQQHMYASMLAAATAAQQQQSHLQQQQHNQQQQQQQQHNQQQPLRSGESPVSPAAMIGTPENMMLPPPNQNGLLSPARGHAYHLCNPSATTATTTTKSTSSVSSSAAAADTQPPHPTSNPASQEQHMAWLRGLNAMAKQNAAQQQQQQPTITQPQQQPSIGHQLTQQTIHAEPTPQVAQLGLHFAAFPHMAFYGHAAAAAAAAMQQGKGASPEESEEKRAKRLERNRESARISRRRKKERLVAAEARVWRTHQKIAKERQIQIEKLVPGLRRLRNNKLAQFAQDNNTDPASIMTAVRETGPNSPIFQAVIDFQFNSLQASLFPRYQKLWLWLALNEEQYFIAGKEEFSKREPDKTAARVSSGKISSKQVGEELMNGTSLGLDNRHVDSGGEGGGRSFHNDDLSSARTCPVHDAARMWPLFCYEHKFSVDQEDKFLALHKKIRHTTDVKASWNKSEAAIKAASSLREAMDFVCRVASNREEQTLVGVLRADQISKYRQWVVMNHDRCSRSLQTRLKQQQQHNTTDNDTLNAQTVTTRLSSPSSHEESLRDICLRLERVLRISKSEK